MTVKAILSSKGRNVVTTEPAATLEDAIAILASHKIGALVVLGPEQRLIGVLSERDIVRALARTASEYYASLAAHGTSEAFRSRMLDFTSLNELIGTPEMLALGKRYESPALLSGKKRGARR